MENFNEAFLFTKEAYAENEVDEMYKLGYLPYFIQNSFNKSAQYSYRTFLQLDDRVEMFLGNVSEDKKIMNRAKMIMHLGKKTTYDFDYVKTHYYEHFETYEQGGGEMLKFNINDYKIANLKKMAKSDITVTDCEKLRNITMLINFEDTDESIIYKYNAPKYIASMKLKSKEC